MEIEPISSSSATAADRWQLWKERVQARLQDVAVAPADRPPAPSSDGVDVELTEHAGTGAQVVQMVDSESGQVLSEIPHHQVLDLVARLLEQNARDDQGGTSGRQH